MDVVTPQKTKEKITVRKSLGASLEESPSLPTTAPADGDPLDDLVAPNRPLPVVTPDLVNDVFAVVLDGDA